MADSSVSLCDEANVDCYAHVVDEVLRSVIACMDEGERDHYLFLHGAFAKCETCLTFGCIMAPISVAVPDWIALEWARASNASPASVWPSLDRAFCSEASGVA